MSEIDYVIYELKIVKEGIFDLKEVYNLMKDFLAQRGYDLTEKEQGYNEKGTLKIKWRADRKVDDYTKFVIEVTVSGSDIKEVEMKKKKAQSGKFSIKFEAELEKDYEDIWEQKPIQKFFRGLYDKFVLGSKFGRYAKDLKEETYAIYNEVKAYTGVNKV